MASYNYYFDTQPLSSAMPAVPAGAPVYPYLFSVPANPESAPPPHTLRGDALLEDGMSVGQWAGLQNGAVVYFESHKGEEGWIDGEPHIMTDHGPYPDGWSLTPPPPPPPTAEEAREAIIFAMQQRLDDFARTRGYDGIVSAASYATSTHPVFAAEGRYAVAARDAAWAAGFAILAAALAGERPMPTWEEVEVELPEMKWPGAEEGAQQ